MKDTGFKGKAHTSNGMPQSKWKITTDDNSTGSVMDTARPMRGPYDRQIGPQSKTNFGRNRDDEKAS